MVIVIVGVGIGIGIGLRFRYWLALDVGQSLGAIARAVASGALTPSEASEFSKLLDVSARLQQVADMEKRLAALEAEKANGRQENG